MARLVLGTGRMADADIQAILTDGDGQPLPSGEPVVVVVSLPASPAVPDLLPFMALSIRNEQIIARTVMRKQ
jgi:hypothetical protein